MIHMRHKYSAMRMLAGESRRGALLVLTLWIIIVLMVMAYSLSYEMRIGMKMTSNGRKRVEAIGLARAGLAKAVTDLKNDQLLKVSEGLYNNDHLKDIWALEDDKTDIKLGEGTYTVRVIDEQGKIDVNSLRPESVNAIIYLLKNVCDVKDDDAELMANALVDFMDIDNKPITGEDESEAEFYTAEGWSRFGDVQPQGWVFRPKNDRLLNIDELMEVPGFSREILYGKSGKVPVNPIDRLDSKKHSTALVDYLTVGQGGPVNINTAPVEVYGALLSIGQHGRGDVRRAASAIDELRKDLTNRRGKNGTGFMSPAQLSEAKVDAALLQGLMQSPLGVSSREYTIISRGRVGAVSQTLEARVVISLQSYDLDTKGEPGLHFIHDLRAMGFLKNRDKLIIDPVLKVTQLKQY